jgi:hypothetical protein
MTQQEIDNLQIGDIVRYQYSPEFEISFLTVTYVNMDKTPHGVKSPNSKCVHFIDPTYKDSSRVTWQDNFTMLKDSFQVFKKCNGEEEEML